MNFKLTLRSLWKLLKLLSVTSQMINNNTLKAFFKRCEELLQKVKASKEDQKDGYLEVDVDFPEVKDKRDAALLATIVEAARQAKSYECA